MATNPIWTNGGFPELLLAMNIPLSTKWRNFSKAYRPVSLAILLSKMRLKPKRFVRPYWIRLHQKAGKKPVFPGTGNKREIKSDENHIVINLRRAFFMNAFLRFVVCSITINIKNHGGAKKYCRYKSLPFRYFDPRK